MMQYCAISGTVHPQSCVTAEPDSKSSLSVESAPDSADKTVHRYESCPQMQTDLEYIAIDCNQSLHDFAHCPASASGCPICDNRHGEVKTQILDPTHFQRQPCCYSHAMQLRIFNVCRKKSDHCIQENRLSYLGTQPCY